MMLSLPALVALATLLPATAMNARGDPTKPSAPKPKTTETLPDHGCYTNMTDIYVAISDDNKLNEPKRFVVCPNTVIDIGLVFPGEAGPRIEKGQYPVIPRSNTEFVCGEDGSSKNNCVLQGGHFGVMAIPFMFFPQDEKVENVQIRGFTFRDQLQYNAFAITEGDISFYDCIFEDTSGFAPVVLSYDNTLDMYDEPKAGDSTLSVFMKDCTFQNLKQHEDMLGVEHCIVCIKGPDNVVKIENCLFLNNDYEYAIKAEKAKVNLKNNCFIENTFYGEGAVLLDGTSSPFEEDGLCTMEGNFVVGANEDLKCAFGYYKDGTDAKCVPPQASQCGIEWYAGNSMVDAEVATSEERDLE